MSLVTRAIDAFTVPNESENGLLSAVVTRRLKPSVAGAVFVAPIVGSTAQTLLGMHNRRKMGKISYSPGMTQMTGTFGSGAVEAMMRGSQGNYTKFAAMAERVVQGDGIINKIDNYGVTPQFISALYNMGR